MDGQEEELNLSNITLNDESNKYEVLKTMLIILGTMIAIIFGLISIQKKKEDKNDKSCSRWFPCPVLEPSKRAYELYVACYTPVWMLIMCLIVATQIYETFTAVNYLQVCVGQALPFLLQPIILPSAGFNSPDANRPLLKRYSFKANVWLAVYSFIGNYWYTHYFYSVLKAKYTMPAHRLNNVPIALYFATHFYFSSYHLFSNMLLRKVVTTYKDSMERKVLYVGVVLVFSYFTAFMETITISSYPDYSFEDFNMACTVGSAFYGIYFIVSFPGFFIFDNYIDYDNSNNKIKENDNNNKQLTLFDTIISSCGHGMIILILLDFVRLQLDIPLVVGILKV